MRIGVVATIALFGIAFASVAAADDDPVAARRQLMKLNNASARTAFQMIKNAKPYDAAAAADAMNEIAQDMVTFPTLFPPGSDQAPQTQASADIFTHMDDFKALADQLITDAKAAAAAAPQGVEAFSVAFTKVNNDCAACHDKYRVE